MDRHRGLALLIALCVLLPACKVAHYRDPNESLPKDWPIPQLTMPGDVELKREPAALHAQDPSMTTREWIVAFDKDGDWPGLVTHVEGCLKPLGYLRQKVTGGPAGFDIGEMQTYYSPDYKTRVLLSNGVGFPGLIEVHDVEFAVWIIESPAPDEIIQTMLDVNQTRPGMGDQLLEGLLEPIP